MATITKPAAPSSTETSGMIPAGIYVVKVTAVENKDSASGQPMFAIDGIILTKDGSDVVDGGFVVGGKKIARQYLSFSPKAAQYTVDRLLKMGVSQEAVDNLSDTSDMEWIQNHLMDLCYQAVLGNEERFRATDLKSYTADGLKQSNEKNKTAHEFILDNTGKPIRTGLNYVVLDIVGHADKNGNPL